MSSIACGLSYLQSHLSQLGVALLAAAPFRALAGGVGIQRCYRLSVWIGTVCLWGTKEDFYIT